MDKYPGWRYHASEPAVIVKDPIDEAERAPASAGWCESPADCVPTPGPVSDPPSPEPLAPADPEPLDPPAVVPSPESDVTPVDPVPDLEPDPVAAPTPEPVKVKDKPKHEPQGRKPRN